MRVVTNLYREICVSKNCDNYYFWEFEANEASIVGGSPYEKKTYGCESCKLAGQTYTIDKYPNDCPHRDEMQALDVKRELQ